MFLSCQQKSIEDITLAVEYNLNEVFGIFMKHAEMCLQKKNTVQHQLGKTDSSQKGKGTSPPMDKYHGVDTSSD